MCFQISCEPFSFQLIAIKSRPPKTNLVESRGEKATLSQSFTARGIDAASVPLDMSQILMTLFSPPAAIR